MLLGHCTSLTIYLFPHLPNGNKTKPTPQNGCDGWNNQRGQICPRKRFHCQMPKIRILAAPREFPQGLSPEAATSPLGVFVAFCFLKWKAGPCLPLLPLSPQPPAPARCPAPWTRALPLLAPSSHTFALHAPAPRHSSPRALPLSAPAPHPRPAPSRSPRSRARPLRARSVPASCPFRARSALARSRSPAPAAEGAALPAAGAARGRPRVGGCRGPECRA